MGEYQQNDSLAGDQVDKAEFVAWWLFMINTKVSPPELLLSRISPGVLYDGPM